MRLVGLALVVALGCHTTPERAGTRPTTWARPLEADGLPNFHELTPTLYRGAMPEPHGFAELERRGIRTVVSLRRFTRDVSVPATGLAWVEIPMWTWAPDEDQVLEFLLVATDPARQPVFVHCAHGADRTGVMYALYRVVVQDWTKDEALAELREGGFGHHEIWDELAQFVRAADVGNMRRQLAARRAFVR